MNSQCTYHMHVALAVKLILSLMVVTYHSLISMLSRRLLLLLLLTIPRQDPLYFSVQSGKSLIPDPGVNGCHCSLHDCLPGPEFLLSVSIPRDLVSILLYMLLLLTRISISHTRYSYHMTNFNLHNFNIH